LSFRTTIGILKIFFSKCAKFDAESENDSHFPRKSSENLGNPEKRINENFAEIGHMGIQINGGGIEQGNT
jgi:hypothetical protein